MKKFTFLMLFLVGATFGVMAQTISQSNSQNISDGDWLTCQTGEISTDNDFYRSFVLADHGIVSPWTVSSVEIGVDQLFFGPPEGYPVTVTLYTTDAPFPGGTLTEIATATELLPELALEVYPFPITGSVPAGSELVVRVSILSDGATSFLLGCNLEGETAPWWLQAEGCGVPDPTTNQDLGFANAWVLNVVGAAGDAVSNPSDCGLAIDITDNACPDNDTTNIAVSGVPGGVMGDNLLLTDVNLIVSHTWDADLEIKLQSPSGVMIDLFVGHGGSGDNLGDPTDPECLAVMNLNMSGGALADGTAPFTDMAYAPDGDFADFNDGGDANGLWSLHICDAAAGDAGQLQFVELVFAQPCPDPSDLAAANITDASADLSWVENGSATEWEVEVVEAGTAPTGAGTVTSDNPYTASGLTQLTDYEFYVRAICADPDMSNWIGPGTFTTALGTLTNPSACGLGLVLTDANCPDNDEFQIEVSGVAEGFILADVDLIIAHTWDADMEMRLTSPGGTTIDLVVAAGGSDDNFGDPTDPNCEAVMNLNMNAATAVADGVAPFVGSYIPAGDFADINNDGGGLNGIWTLLLCDGAAGDVGTLMYVALGFDDATAINELSFDNNVGVYPNPVTSLLTVEVNGEMEAGSIISLVNLQGKVIYNEVVNDKVSGYRTEIDMTAFAKGIYVLKLEDENSSIQKKVILQ